MPNDKSESKLDEALEETFPASDPTANTVETGIRSGELPSASSSSVVDNREREQFELSRGGHTAFLVYKRTVDTLTLVHTEVPPALRGQHVGETLVEAALHSGRSEGLRIVVV